MRLLISSLLCLALLQLDAQRGVLYYSVPQPGFATSRISKSALEKDIDYWQRVIEESHVNPYHAISRENLLLLKKQLLASLPDSVTHFQASFTVSQLIGALQEGHLGFATSPVIDSLYANDCIRFPYLLLDIDKGDFIVQRDLSGDNRLPLFSRIISINGKSTKELYQRYARMFGGLELWKILMVKNNIRKLLYMDGITSPFSVKAIVNDDTVSFVTKGYTRFQADSINKVLSAENPPLLPFRLSFPRENIALIQFNTMGGYLRDSFSRFLRSTFAQIQARKTQGLIIDLRLNGGGDSGLGDSLISYFTGKSYRTAGGVKIRISRHSKEHARLNGFRDPYGNMPDGSLREIKDIELVVPVQRELRFSGKTCILVGTGTFSSANMITNAIKDYQLATIIGERTAEPANDFGEIFYFMLPNTHIVCAGAIKMFVRANGDEHDFNGIQPDIEARNSLDDIRLKKDRVLERAIEWINGQ
jgi:hypothetical protein